MHSYPEFYTLCQSRFSCRSYSDRPVGHDTLMAIFDVARLSPSACNRQPWMFILVSGEDEREAVRNSYPREWFASAPEYVIACGLHDEGWHRQADGKDHTDIDVAIAVEHFCLGAASMHLGTCWVCNFDASLIRSAFNLADGMEPEVIIPIGYPSEGTVAPVKLRKQLDEILHTGKFLKD